MILLPALVVVHPPEQLLHGGRHEGVSPEVAYSRKCKAETGFSINNYIKIVKVEKAKTLLLSTDMSIQDICGRLHFGSCSFFAETFKEITGIPACAAVLGGDAAFYGSPLNIP